MLATLRANIALTLVSILAAILLAISVYQAVVINGFLWVDGLKDKNEILARDNNELRFAAKEAKRLNDEQVARIEAEQQKVTNDVEADLHARLERLRSELRSKAAPRNPNGSQASPDGKAAPGIDEAPRLCLSTSELLSAAENEERHDQLITWVEEQLKVVR